MDIHGRYPSSSRITVLMAPLLLSYLTIVSISLGCRHGTREVKLGTTTKISSARIV
jgi:hypothetical protein